MTTPRLMFDITLEQPLGEGGERLHEWAVRLASWRAQHRMEGGERGLDDEVVVAQQYLRAGLLDELQIHLVCGCWRRRSGASKPRASAH